MRKRIAIVLVAFSILMFLTASAGTTSAADYTRVGVRTNDTAYYDSNVNWLGMFPIGVNRTSIQVLNVTGKVVFFASEDYWANGSVYNGWGLGYRPLGFSINMSYGPSSSSCPYFLIAPNLVGGDQIYPDPAFAGYKINTTISMDILGQTRDVNMLNGTYYGFRVLLYWDKATGLLVKAINQPTFWCACNFTLLSTTALVPAAPSLLSNPMTFVAIGEGVLIAALIALMALRGRGKKR